MEFENLTYLLLLLIFLLIPAVLSFRQKVRFASQLKYVLPAVLFSGAIFIIWDLRFTELGIWSFDNNYLLGIYFRGLPLEEWLSFLFISICSIYLYEVLSKKITHFGNPDLFVVISLVLLVVFALIAYFMRQKLYPFFTFFLLTIYFGYTIFRNRFKNHYPGFYAAYIIFLFPYLTVRLILTSIPVISFNSTHIINKFLFTIPLEDFGYFFLFLLMNITIYEYLRERQFY
ncbi:MAG: lycopene cyclase domain-containing protein [Prolixibacteraceae bacterium]|nr:lycopene cyclase domain-containing protein [Prolixibacteraceae bacterium]